LKSALTMGDSETRDRVMALLEKTAPPNWLSLEEESKKQIKLMEKETEKMRIPLQNSLEDIEGELQLVVVELATCEEICRQSCYKRQVCVDVQALREERPGEWKENDTATDEAVTAQAGEVDTSITEITEYQERLQIALKEVEDKRAPLAENVSMKNTAEGVDASTLALKRGDGYDELPRSTLEPEAWVQQAEDLVQQTTDAIAHSVETRTEIHPLCVARVETEETCWQALVECLHNRQLEWNEFLQDLDSRMTAKIVLIEDLEQMAQQLAVRLRELRKTLLLAESRLERRLTRPEPERKADTAEEALIAEVEQLRAMCVEVEEEIVRIEEEIRRIWGEIYELSKEFSSAHHAREIDVECLVKLGAGRKSSDNDKLRRWLDRAARTCEIRAKKASLNMQDPYGSSAEESAPVE